MDWLTSQFSGLRLQEGPAAWLLLVALSLAMAFGAKVASAFLAKRFERWTDKTTIRWDNAVPDLLLTIRPWCVFVVCVWAFSKPLKLPPFVADGLRLLAIAAAVYQTAVWGLRLLYYWRKVALEPKIKKDRSSAAALGLFFTGAQAGLILILILIGMSNVGIDITALLTGLGIGGIAVALAAQNVLGDLLASLSIILDKPFVLGDFIVSGSEKGTVENIGIKTTRIRSLSGEQIVLSNKDLLESRVLNFQRLERRRCAQKLGVRQETPPDKLEQIPVWIEEIVKRYDLLQFDVCTLTALGASSLDYDLVFYVGTSNYNSFVKLQEKVLLEILRKFHEEGVHLALPRLEIRQRGPFDHMPVTVET